MRSFEDLPKEIVVEIMSWLPADSLVQLKLVNKTCCALVNALITDPVFVSKHLNYEKTRLCPKLALSQRSLDIDSHIRNFGESYDLLLLTPLNVNSGSDTHICSSTELLQTPICRFENKITWPFWEEVYHCDGIIVRVVRGDVVVLCNPVLREFHIFPGPTYDEEDFDCGRHVGAFGYDFKGNSYKIVRLFQCNYTGITRAKVFTLGTRSWREVNFPEDVSFRNIEGMCSNGVCYWVANDFSNNIKILCFDMYDEEFYVVPIPDSAASPKSSKCHQLAEWNDTVASIHLSESHDKQSCVEVFVMEGSSDGAKGTCSWTKRLHFGIEHEIESVLKFWKSDEILMLDSSKTLVSYNLVTKRFRHFFIDEVGLVKFKKSYFWPLLYVKSLVSVTGRSTS